MEGIVDELIVEASSGHGGAGAVHFRREKYVPRGGPDGGDGGDGGDVALRVRRNLKTLSHLKMPGVFRAENGKPGGGSRRHGRNGGSLDILVPPGTLVKDPDTGQVLKDLGEESETWLLLKGGKGGRGNWHFATSVRQTPRYAQPGLPGETRRILLELNLIADIGFIGLPNAGKSTLLAALTRARPKIGSYPFTTTSPNIGVMRCYDQDILLADIPGIIAGASRGAGLGLRFLKHVNRTRALAFLIDLSDPGNLEAFPVLCRELETFDGELLRRPRLLVATKLDLEAALGAWEGFQSRHRGERILGVSARSGAGIEELRKALTELAGGS